MPLTDEMNKSMTKMKSGISGKEHEKIKHVKLMIEELEKIKLSPN